MWKNLKTILPSKSLNNNSYDFSPDEFNEYFSTIGNKLESNFDSDVIMPTLNINCPDSFNFSNISISFITNELFCLKNKTSIDVLGLNGTVLSMASHIIAPSLAVLFNKSLTLGYVPDDWKLARVTPLYKGNGSRNVLGNYRPISVISHVPKILEKYVNCMLNTYLCEHSLLYNDQFAYVKSQSTVNALHTLVDTTLYNINNSLLTGIVQHHLKKGFDTINHKILLYKLQKYGISSNCLNWFKSYLNNRKQIVKCNDKLSQPCLLSIGVPQGTILGPTLFILYFNDFSNYIDPTLCIRYAYDTSLVAWGANINEVQSKLQLGTDKALEWLHKNRLLVNNDKSTCIILGTRQRISNLILNIHISGTSLTLCNETKLLGIILDSCLSWDKHIDYICKKVSPKIGILYRLSQFLSINVLKIVYNTIIQPDFDYCISVWGNCSLIYLNKLQVLQNRAARIILKEFDWNVRTNVLLTRLGWMSMKTRRDYFAGIILFKTLHGHGLNYLSNQIIYTNEQHNYNTRAASNNVLVLPKPNCELYKTSMQYYGLELWNSLPNSVKSSQSVYEFKRLYKQYLMDNNNNNASHL